MTKEEFDISMYVLLHDLHITRGELDVALMLRGLRIVPSEPVAWRWESGVCDNTGKVVKRWNYGDKDSLAVIAQQKLYTDPSS